MLQFKKWKNYKEILEKYPLIVYPRKDSYLNPYFVKNLGGNISIIDSPLYDVSSTLIRKLVAEKKCLNNLISPEIEKEIRELYKFKLLLHTCCAPCSSAIIESLIEDNIRPTIYFYNPNIAPRKEYEIRKNECIRFALSLDIEFIDGDYEHKEWLNYVAGHEKDRERGERCQLCFDMRMKQTAQLASEKGYTHIATTLASSRWKDLNQINTAGTRAVQIYKDIRFLAKNWRQGGLALRRKELIKQYNFYNQTYCGCEFSRQN